MYLFGSRSKLPVYSLSFNTFGNAKIPRSLRRDKVACSETLGGLIAVQTPLCFTWRSNSPRPMSYPFIKRMEVGFDLFSPSVMHLIRPTGERDVLRGEKDYAQTSCLSTVIATEPTKADLADWREITCPIFIRHRISVIQSWKSLSSCRPRH